MININNDNTKVSSVNETALQKILPVQHASSIQNPPQQGSTLPVNAATSGRETEAQQAHDPVALDKAVQNINENMQAVQRELHFSIDDESGKTVIKIIDLATEEVIRQIPNEEALAVARRLSEGADLKLFSGYT
jgi:flagellar protein FlaG